MTDWLDKLATDGTPDFAECLQYLAHVFPALTQFATTEQDPEWHGEGNVAIHTDRVLSALYQLLETDAAHITGKRRQALIMAALLHDVAKPWTTARKMIHGQERVVAPHHERIGRDYIALPLMELGLDYPVVTTIMGLVGFHDQPKRLVVKNADYASYLKLAINTDVALLYWLERADMLGRTCPDQQGQLAILDEFKLFAEEYQLWENPHVREHLLTELQIKSSNQAQRYVNGYAIDELIRRQTHLPVETLARTYTDCTHYAELYVLCGISGSGKSHWVAQQLQMHPDWIVISLDAIRVELNGTRHNQKNRGQMMQLAKQRLKAALAKKQSVIWDATNLRTDFREQLTSLGREYGAFISLILFHIDKPTLLKQNRNRPYAVPESVLHNQCEKMQWPTVEEAHAIHVIGKNGRLLPVLDFNT